MRGLRGMSAGVLAVSTALALAACGSSGSGGSSSSPTSGGGASTSSSTPAGGGSSSSSGGGSVTKIGMAYDVGGRGDKSFNDLAAKGLDEAKAQLGASTKELAATKGESEQSKESRLQLLASSGYNPVVAVGFAYATAVSKVVPKFPNTKFAIIDDDENCNPKSAGGLGAQPNVECLLFTENESSYLVGVAAALASKVHHIGFIGGVNEPLIQKFQAGYDAGAKSVDPSIKIDVKYLTQPPDFGGFGDPAKGKTAALGMYADGADVVYHAAGGSGAGLFDAAKQDNKLAIGVDSDQYQTAPADEKSLILTSALKGVDTAVLNFIISDSKGQFKAGSTRFSLKDNGVGYATSNPLIDKYKAKIEQAKADIISGKITVPTKP